MSNKKILIVEDDEDFTFILEKKFTIEGFSIFKAKDGKEGINVAKEKKPDLILSDMLMAKVDGMEMAKKIRKFDAKVPIIFLTNVKNEQYTLQMQKSANFDYLIKSDTRIDEIVKKCKEKLGM